MKLTINLNNSLDQALVDALSSRMPAVLAMMRDRWIAGSPTPAYRNALLDKSEIVYTLNGNPFTGKVTVDSAAVRVRELGAPSRDMKPGLLRGPKSRPAKRGGRYNIIPIGFSTESGFDAWQFYGVSPFRTVSSRSLASSWIYPAIQPQPVLQEVHDAVAFDVGRLLSEALKEWR